MISSKADSRSEEITEHKLAEEALRAERDRAEKYLNIVEVIIVALDTQARITLLNRKGHQVLGYEEGELIGKDWIHTCLRPQDHRSVHEVNRKINAGEIQAFEYYENYVLTKKGEERFIAWHTTILKDDNSRIIGTLSSGEDITERKMAEEKAKESEEKYRQLVENSLMGIGLSKGNQVIFANSALLRIFGYDSLEEFLKNPLIDPVAPESRELIATRKREISEGKSMPSVFEYTILRKDGTTRILRASSSSITLGGKIYKQTTFQDITEQKQAEEALRESENKYRAIFENTGTATVIVEDDTTISLANSEFGRLTGYSREEIEGKMSWTEFVVKEDLEKMLRQHKLRRTDQAAALKSYEFRIKDRNGNIKDILLNIDIIPGTKKSIASLLDITERKRAEEELKRTQSSIRIAMDLVKLVRWEYDVETDLFTFDDQFYALYGTTAEREGGPLMSSQDYARKFIPAEEAPLVAEEINKSLATTDPNFTSQVEHRIIRADGTEGFIAVRFAVVKDDKGRTIKTYGANQDITERKLAEKALKDSERTLQEQLNFLQQLIDSIPNPIFYKDTKGIYLGCNTAFETITGYCKDKIVGHTVYELYPKEFADVYYEADNKLFQNPGVQIYEASMAHTDGSRHDVMFNKATYFDTEGRLAGLVGIILDITERKHMEIALKESERRLADIINFLPDATLVIDKEGKVIAWNKAIEAMTGIKAQDILGKGDYEYALPFYGQRGPMLVDIVLEPQPEIEKRYSDLKWVDGTLIGYAFTPNLKGVGAYVWGVASLIYDSEGKIVGAIESVKDITEQKKMEKALQDSMDYLDKIINSIGDPLFVKDRQHRMTLVNDAACKLFGRPREEIIGKTADDLFPSKEMAEVSRMKDEEVFNTSIEVTNEETNTYADKTLTVLVKKTPYTDNAGNQFLVGITRDITDRKQAEDKIIASLKEKEVLLKEVHHRVKNNLQVISALLYLQSSNLKDENIIKIFRDSQDRIKSMALIHENLYKSKDLGKVNFNEYINQLISYLSQSYGDISRKINFKVNSENVFLNINTAIPCGMIINELVSNSIKHAFKYGRSGEICIDISSEDDGFKLIVSDNGVGIKGDINIENSKTLGFRLIDTLVRQIDGKMSLDTINGFKCEIHFKGLK